MKRKITKNTVISILILTLLISSIHMFFIPNETQAAQNYTQYIKSGIASFPESYQKKLAYLKFLHPNWEFKAYYTGIEWNDLISGSNENRCLKNTIYKNYLLDPSALCVCGRQGDANYYCASAKTVNYYLDPRNFMGEAMIFQFLDLSNGSGISREVVEKAVSGTFLQNQVDDIMTAASQNQLNPLHIVATIFQEIGKTGTPAAISGTVPGYEGYYNFYNYGASDGSGAVERGLAKAKEYNWNSKSKALIEGAKKALANEYISYGQTTKYFYKFDVVGNEIITESSGNKTYSSDYFFNHQYMTNLRDPSSQAGTLYDIYADNEILDQKLTFTIPVYNNMPSEVSVPTSLSSGNLYYINSLKKWGINFRSSPGGTALGNIYKDTVVELLSNEGAWSRVKIIRATGFSNSGWSSCEQIGYVSSEYLTKVGTELPDYRSQVNMGTSTVNIGNVTQTSEFKVDGDNIKMTPTVTAKEIKDKNSDAIIKKADGTDISTTNELVGTGYTVETAGKTFIVIKLGDINGDGYVDTGDTLFAKQYLLNKRSLTGVYLTAMDVNKDSYADTGDTLLLKRTLLKLSSIQV